MCSIDALLLCLKLDGANVEQFAPQAIICPANPGDELLGCHPQHVLPGNSVPVQHALTNVCHPQVAQRILQQPDFVGCAIPRQRLIEHHKDEPVRRLLEEHGQLSLARPIRVLSKPATCRDFEERHEFSRRDRLDGVCAGPGPQAMGPLLRRSLRPKNKQDNCIWRDSGLDAANKLGDVCLRQVVVQQRDTRTRLLHKLFRLRRRRSARDLVLVLT